jgi:hypothetical protein
VSPDTEKINVIQISTGSQYLRNDRIFGTRKNKQVLFAGGKTYLWFISKNVLSLRTRRPLCSRMALLNHAQIGS